MPHSNDAAVNEVFIKTEGKKSQKPRHLSNTLVDTSGSRGTLLSTQMSAEPFAWWKPEGCSNIPKDLPYGHSDVRSPTEEGDK